MFKTLFTAMGSAARGLWWLLEASRRALLNLLLLALVLGLGWLLLRPIAPALLPKTALVLNLSGPVVEQYSGGVRDTALKQLQGEATAQVRLRDVLAVLDAAAKDDKIAHAVLMLDEFAGGGLPTLRELAAAIERFKAAGKPVYAWGSQYDQRQYYLAAHASEAWVHPMGAVYIEGMGRYRNYYKDLFDRVGVSANVLRVGKFKNAAETFSANAPSKETLEAEGLLFNALWSTWTGGVEGARKLPAGSINQGIEALPASLVAVGGDPAKLALQGKLVDGLKTRDELRALLIERGSKDREGKTFAQVSFKDYLARIKPRSGGNAVGIVVAEGPISDMRAPGGRNGGLSTSDLIRQAREDDKIKALVLRIDSPGGSAFGSELVRRELELTRLAGKPVVVSMGDLAASGGYWISMAADEIIADEATITGSIGVVALLPTAQAALDKLGVKTGGHTSTWLAGAYDVRRGLDPRFAALVQSAIDRIYTQFTQLAAGARKRTPEQIDAVGQGRVWTGAQALERGLVDRTGSLADAVAAAATRAKLADGHRVQYVERKPSGLDRVLTTLGQGAVDAMVGLAAPLGGASWMGLPLTAAAHLQEDLAWMGGLAQQRQPYAAVVHCLCDAP